MDLTFRELKENQKLTENIAGKVEVKTKLFSKFNGSSAYG